MNSFIFDKKMLILRFLCILHFSFLACASEVKEEIIGQNKEEKNEKHLTPFTNISQVDKKEEGKAIPCLRLNKLPLEGSESITRRKSLENTKSSFLAHMSHELRTPLTGILGALELMDKDSLTEQNKNYLNIAYGSGLALLSLVNNVLDVSKIEAGCFKLENVRFNPLKLAQEVQQTLKPEALKKNLDFEIMVNSNVPMQLMGDPTRIRQIFFNLVSNAIKFTEKGKVCLSLNGDQSSEEAHFILAGQVIDTGIGIESTIVNDLFKPFVQADESLLRRFGGTGLGLFITKQLCEMMNGNISVSSKIGKGSTFTFKLQLKTPDMQGMKASTRPYELASPNNPNRLPNIKILVVEDNAANQKILVNMLIKAGCSVAAVWNGQEAVESIKINSYDLILMDGEMPVMDGLVATQIIRKTLDSKSLPIIGVTAHTTIDDRERFLKAGMNSYLTKPIQRQILINEILRCYLENKNKGEMQSITSFKEDQFN